LSLRCCDVCCSPCCDVCCCFRRLAPHAGSVGCVGLTRLRYAISRTPPPPLRWICYLALTCFRFFF
jgi:hypothetical protein